MLVLHYLTYLHQNGQAILLITHDDRLVCRYARRIIRLAEGRVVADGYLPAPAAPTPWPAPTTPFTLQEIKR